LTISSIKVMAVGQEKRGPDAFGVAWIDGDNHIHHFKSDGRISENLDIFDRMHDAKAIIGHTRWATHGDPEDNVNNHPHAADGGWLVHNGQIPNHEDLTDEFDLLRSSDCDSEVLGLLIQHLNGTLVNRVIDTVNLCDTTMPLNMAGLWNRPNRVAVMKRGNPLVMGKGGSGNIYFASLKQGVPGNEIETPDNTLWMFDLASGNTKTYTDSIMEYEHQTGVKILGSTFEDEDDATTSDNTTSHRVTFEWDSDEAEVDTELEAFTKARNKLSPTRQAALDALNERVGGGVFDGTKYVNGRRVRQIKVDKKKMKAIKKAKAEKARAKKAKNNTKRLVKRTV
jgi:glucosamine 6-phosphate synthetase-like amidotransferase/phosphosugar isomerase protein